MRGHRLRPISLLAFLVWAAICTAQSHSNPLPSRQNPLTADEVLSRVSRSVFVVETFDESGSLVSTGTAAFVARRTYEWREGIGGMIKPADNIWVVTNKHVVDPSEYRWWHDAIRVGQGETLWHAGDIRNTPYDAAFLNVSPDPEIDALPVVVRNSPLASGERVYIIDGEKGSHIIEGVVTGVQPEEGTGELKMKGVSSLGPNGGAIFDRFGRLVGVTSPWANEERDLSFTAVCTDMVNVFTPRAADLGQPLPVMDFQAGCAGTPQLSKGPVEHWYWFRGCQGNTRLGLQVLIDGDLVYSGELPICRLAEKTGTAGLEDISFAFKGGHLFQGKDRTTAEQTMQGYVRQVASDIGDLTLQITFSRKVQDIALCSVHVVRPDRASATEIDRGIVVKTFPLSNK